MKYAVKIIYPDKPVSYLADRDKSTWCKKTAQKYAAVFLRDFPGCKVEIEPDELENLFCPRCGKKTAYFANIESMEWGGDYTKMHSYDCGECSKTFLIHD